MQQGIVTPQCDSCGNKTNADRTNSNIVAEMNRKPRLTDFGTTSIENRNYASGVNVSADPVGQRSLNMALNEKQITR